MTKQKFIVLLMVLLLLFGVFTPSAYAVEIVDVPFTSAPSPDDVFNQCGIADDAWTYWKNTIGATSPSEFSNQILIDYGPNWSSHPAAKNRYCYVFSGMPNMVYSDFYGYTDDNALSSEEGIIVVDYYSYINGRRNNYFDTYIVSTMSFVFRAPYAVVWNDGITSNSVVEAETYSDPEGGVQYDLVFYNEGDHYWPNSEFTYEMAVSIYDGNYESFPVIVFAQNGLVPYDYYYTIYEDGSEYQITMNSDSDFVFGDGVGTPDVPGTEIDLSGVIGRLDHIIENQNEQTGILSEISDLLTAIQEEVAGMFADVLAAIKNLPETLSGIAEDIKTLPDTIANAIAAALENMEIGGDGSGNGRNFFDMIVGVIDRIMDFFEHAFDGIIAFAQSILDYIAAIGEVVVDYLLEALKQLASILELILLIPGWITTVLGFLPPDFANFVSLCVSVLFVVLLIRFAINIIK